MNEDELHRNASAAETQRNHNPLADHPEWAPGIGFSGVWA